MDDDVVQGARTVSRFCRLNMNQKRHLPLRPSHIGFLIYVVERDDAGVTPLEAAQFFGVTKPVVTKTIASLVERGYVNKTPSAKDKRSYTITATDAAKSLVADETNDYYRVMRVLDAVMGASRYTALLELLDEANSIIETMTAKEDK